MPTVNCVPPPAGSSTTRLLPNIRYEDVASPIHRYSKGRIQSSCRKRGLRSASSWKLHHPVVAGIRNEHIARSIHRYSVRPTQPVAYRGLSRPHLPEPSPADCWRHPQRTHRPPHLPPLRTAIPHPLAALVVCAPPPAGTSTTCWLSTSAMKTSPAPSTATPLGPFSPVPTVV